MALEYELVVLSDDWHGLPFSCKHLIKHFLPDVPVLWVDTIGLRSPKLNSYDIRRAAQKLAGWLAPGRRVASPNSPGNLRVIDPWQIPYYHFSLIRELNKRSLVRAVGRKPPGHKRVLLTTWPFLGNLIGALDEDLSVYYRVDDFSEFPGVRRETMRTLENELIGKCDLIVGSAESLAEVSNLGKTGHYLPHGVDFEHFARPAITNCSRRIADFAVPRIGFFGLLSSWVDLELIRQVALNRPGWSFVFLGSSQLSSSELPVLPNLHFLGYVPYSELPGCAQLFDVGLIPFRIDSLTRVVNPLKLLEYFAMGIPVVSTPLPEVMKHGDSVYIAQGPDRFTQAIEMALRDNTPERRKALQRLAQDRGWAAQSARLRVWIEDAIRKKLVPL